MVIRPTCLALLFLLPPGLMAAPINDSFATPIPLNGATVSTNGTNVGATKQPGEPNHAGDAGGKSVWWFWTAPFTGSVGIDTFGSNFDTLLAAYTGATVSALILVAANDQDLTDPLGGDHSRVKFDAVAGTDYRIAVDGFSGASGSIVLTIAPPPRPPNDDFASAAALSGIDVTAHGSNIEATKEPGEYDHADEPGGHSVWWNWVAPFSSTATIATLGSDFDTVLAVYTGDEIDQLDEIASNDQDPLGGDTSHVEFAARAGTRYWIAVDGWNRESGAITLTVKLRPPPPRLTDPVRRPDRSFALRLRGIANIQYTIDARENIGTTNAWIPLATNRLDTAATWMFHDPSATNFSRRFYRGRALF